MNVIYIYIFLKNLSVSLVNVCNRIYVEDLLALGVENGSYEMRTTKYKVEGLDGTYCGDIKVGVKFISQVYLHIITSTF